MSDDDRYQVSGSLSAEERSALAEEVERTTRLTELADPDAHLGPIGRAVNRAVEFVGICTLGVIATMVFVNASLRYAVNGAIVWAEEFVISLIPLMAFVGLFLSVRRRRLIRIETFTDMLPAVPQRWLRVVIHVLSAGVFLYLAINGVRYLQLFGADPMVYFDLPKGLFQGALTVGAFILAAAFAVQAWQTAVGSGER
jgi:TRAP-type C4-dicarboxylate transport system permease small subunit